MFGIGAGELVLIVIVVLLAVGPNQMPKMLRVVGRGMREVRKATRELQSTVGLNEILTDEEIRDPLGLKKPAPKPVTTPRTAAVAKPAAGLSDDDLVHEQPAVGVDLDLAYARSKARIIAAKEAAAAEEAAAEKALAAASVVEPGAEPGAGA